MSFKSNVEWSSNSWH